MWRVDVAWLLLLTALPSCRALVGAQKLAESIAPAPQQRLQPPEISFQLEPEEPQRDDENGWRELAQRAASLQQLRCHEDLLGATTRMVDAAEDGDTLAMAGLGAMCKCLRSQTQEDAHFGSDPSQLHAHACARPLPSFVASARALTAHLAGF